MKIRKELQRTIVGGRSLKLYAETSTRTGKTELIIKDSQYHRYPIKDYKKVVEIFDNWQI